MLRIQQSWEVTQHRALIELGHALVSRGYRFTTITPASHSRVIRRVGAARTLRDIFGWSRPFAADALEPTLFALLQEAGCVERRGDLFRATVRFSSLGENLFVHSAFPTTEADAVFFGPDTYRYVASLERVPGRFVRAVDIGAGTGAGLLSLAPRCDELVLADINERALRFCAVNAELAGVPAHIVQSDVLRQVPGDFDLIVSNPPYLVDGAARAYRHGGDRGIELAARIVEEALPRLRPGGVLCVYTGTPVVDGIDLFRERIRPHVQDLEHQYEELDVDVFGEELDEAAYADVERIALVLLTVWRRAP